MKKLSTLLMLSVFAPAISFAQTSTSDCIVQPTCEELGYKYSSEFTCTTLGLNYVTCPFDKTKFACISKLPGISSNGSVSVQTACETAGYPYTAAQCGKMGTRQIGIPCPYSSNYYYCDYPNKNAAVGWYLCANGTASSTTTGCGGRSYIIGIVIKAPTSGLRGVVALTKYGYYGNGDLYQDFCKNVYSSYGAFYTVGIMGTPRPPNTSTEPSLIKQYFSQIKTELSYNWGRGSSLAYPLWAAECWDTGTQFNCHIITSSGTLGEDFIGNQKYGVCVAYF